jgi:anti-sigma B factor antagonist
MHFKIEQREREGITILDLKGRLIFGENEVSLRDRLEALLAQGVRKVILNFKDVSHLDTTGLGTLTFCTEKFRAAGGKLALADLSPEHVNAADALKLDTALEMHADEQDAVNSFFPERLVPHYDLLELVEQIKARRAAGQSTEIQKDEKC